VDLTTVSFGYNKLLQDFQTAARFARLRRIRVTFAGLGLVGTAASTPQSLMVQLKYVTQIPGTSAYLTPLTAIVPLDRTSTTVLTAVLPPLPNGFTAAADTGTAFAISIVNPAGGGSVTLQLEAVLETWWDIAPDVILPI
jgi:hypothetical protein